MSLYDLLFGKCRRKRACASESPPRTQPAEPANDTECGLRDNSPCLPSPDGTSVAVRRNVGDPSEGVSVRHRAPACLDAANAYFASVVAAASRTDHNFYVEYKRLLDTAKYARFLHSMAIADYAAAVASACVNQPCGSGPAHTRMLEATRTYASTKAAEQSTYAEATRAKSLAGKPSPIATKAYAAAKAAFAEATKEYVAASEAYLATDISSDHDVSCHISAVREFLTALDAYVASRTAKERTSRMGEDREVTAASVALAEACRFKNSMIPPDSSRSPSRRA